MNDDILVSVFCLAYNHGKYIRETLDGFVKQITNFKYEVIIHDDASTDGTADIIREYAKKYPDIIKPILQKENQYSQKKPIINTYIIPQLRGKYIAFCEGDDCWIDNNKLQIQVDFLETHNDFGACVHQTTQLNCQTGKRTTISRYDKDCIVDRKTVLQGGNIAFQLSSLVVRREIYLDVPEFRKLKLGFTDYPFSIQLVFGSKVYFLNRNMSLYRLYSCETSWTSRNADVWKEKKAEHTKKLIKILEVADKYYQNRFHKEFSKQISYFEYTINDTIFNKKFVTDPYWCIFLLKSLFVKIKVLLSKMKRYITKTRRE